MRQVKLIAPELQGLNFKPEVLADTQLKRVKNMKIRDTLDLEIRYGRVKSLMKTASNTEQKILITSELPAFLAFLTEVMIADLSSRSYHETAKDNRKTICEYDCSGYWQLRRPIVRLSH